MVQRPMLERLSPVARLTSLILIAAGTLLACLPHAAWAGGSGDSNVPDDTIKRRDDTINPALLPVSKGEIRFNGTVLDKDSRPLPGIQLKVYVNGLAIHTATTDKVGQYDFRCPIN